MREILKNLLKRLGLLKHYCFLRYGLKYKIKAALNPQVNFYTLSPDLLIALNSCLRKAQSLRILDGTDYLEFGLFRGFSFWYAQAAAQEMKASDMRFFGFDSFQGLPELEGIDERSGFSKGVFKAGHTLVVNFLTQYGVNWDKTFLIEGFYSDSLNDETKKQHSFRKCSICVVDSDLYESAKDVLSFVAPLLNDKSFIIFDDWNCNQSDDTQGERKAFAEFLERNPNIKSEPYGQFGNNCQAFLLEKQVSLLNS